MGRMSEGVHFSLFRGESNGASGPPHREFQELWFTLAKRNWSSLVLAPADEGISAAGVASELADVGSRVRDRPVAAIVADAMDFESARILADLQHRVRDAPDPSDRLAPLDAAGSPMEPQPAAGAPSPSGADRSQVRAARLVPGAGQVVVAIQPVVVEPLGVAVAHAADAVVLCLQLGRSRRAAVRRTIELIGADCISGAILVP